MSHSLRRKPDLKNMKEDRKAQLLLTSAAVIWGTTFVVGKLSLEFFGAIYLGFLENALGGAILLGALLAQEIGNHDNRVVSSFRNPKTLLLGLLNGIAYTLQYIGLAITEASKAGLLVNVGVTFVPFFALFLLHDPLNRRELGALCMAIVGASFISTGGDLSVILQGGNFGDLMVLAAGILWALWIVVAQASITEMQRPLRVAAPNAIFTGVIMGIAALFAGQFTLEPLQVLTAQMYVLYLGVMSIGLAYMLYYEGLKRAGGTKSAIYLLMQALVAMILGVALLAEELGLVALVGAVLVLCAIGFAGSTEKTKAAKTEE